MRPLQRLLVAAAALPAVGCYATWDIGPSNINTLHVDKPPAAKVLDSKGRAVTVDRDTELIFHAVGPVAQDLDVKFESLAVYGGPWTANHEWWVSGVLRGDGRGIRIDMNQVESLTAKRFSPGKTAWLVVGLVVGACAVAATAVGVIVGVALSSAE